MSVNFPPRLRRERDNLLELAMLAGWSILTVQLLDLPAPDPLPALAILVAGLLTSRQDRLDREAAFWSVWRSRLPWQGLVVVVAGSALCLWNGLPRLWLAPVLTWPVVVLFVRLAWRARGPMIAHFHRHAGQVEILAEATALAVAIHFGAAFWSLWNFPPVAVAAVAAWIALRLIVARFPRDSIRPEFTVPALAAAAIAIAGISATAGGLNRGHGLVAAGLAAALVLARWHLRRIAQRGRARGAEALRLALLAASACWILRGLATPTFHGAPDAQWYATMLQDITQQVRSGEFPVFLGQTPNQFNGSLFPLRVAPAFHHLGVLFDTLTWHSLGMFALQNLMLTCVGILAAFLAYGCLTELAGDARELGLVLALLFLSCPGVAGLAYNNDLYMTWTTLPPLVVAFAACVRTFMRPSRSGFVLLGGATGLLWWGHTPIAFWTTIILASMQLLRLAATWRQPGPWLPLLLAAVCFAAIAAYPLGSVLLFPPEAGVKAGDFQRAEAFIVAKLVRDVFPASILPLSPAGRTLGDFQIGYALAALGAAGAAWNWRRRSLAAWGLFAWAAILGVLLFPWPGVNLWAWNLVPAVLRDTTGNWAMNRLYLLGAATLVTALAISLPRPGGSSRAAKVVLALLAMGLLWSFTEVRKFAVGSRLAQRTRAESDARLLPENVMLTRFAYLMFPQVPSHFSHGVMDAELLHRLFAPDLQTVVEDNQQAALERSRPLDSVRLLGSDADPARYEADRPVVLRSGHRYLARWTFQLPANHTGVIQIRGETLRREYALPDYGEPRSFGRGGQHGDTVSLFTSQPQPETVHFAIAASSPTHAPGQPVGAMVELREFEPETLPVQVTSWTPYRSLVRAAPAGWLETPRMFQRGYVATVNGTAAEIRKSPDGLVAIALPTGESRVELRWHPPTGLLVLYVFSVFSLVGWIAWAARRWFLGPVSRR